MAESETPILVIEPEPGEDLGTNFFEQLVGPNLMRTEPVQIHSEADGRIQRYRFTGTDTENTRGTDGNYGTTIDLGDNKHVVMTYVQAIGVETPSDALLVRDGEVVEKIAFYKREGAAIYQQDYVYSTDGDPRKQTAGEGQGFDLNLGRALLKSEPPPLPGNPKGPNSQFISHVRSILELS